MERKAALDSAAAAGDHAADEACARRRGAGAGGNLDAAGGLTRDEALARLRAAATAEADADSWSCPVGPFTLRFPNFAWRRRALAAHDLHHAMTGYPMTMRGEYQMAAWELGAGRYPHWGATLFCAPLVVAGLLWSPQRIWTAFRRGRASTSLYPALAEQGH